jgi:3alpha(or 20beta)-hydroxysteroid dehydrogenase
MPRLEGKVALITGAVGGQGAAAVRRFVAEGARVMIADINDDEGKELADEFGEGAVYQHLDVSDEADWAAAIDRVVGEFGLLNVLVNNAGILHFAELKSTTLADYERVIRVNQIGTFLGMRAVIEPMSEAHGGSIINVSSVEGLAAMPFLPTPRASSRSGA